MEQMNVFAGSKPFKVDKPIRLIELFAGIGAQAKALERMGVPFEHYRICEFDKYAVASYNAVHETDFATSDITQITADDLGIVNTDTYCYIMTYSFPCQDLSIAGKQKGMEKGSNTRSGLLWEVERLLDECTELPQVLLMENVTQVHGKKNADSFRQWCDKLESLGYKNYWQDLNSKDFGVPQNRNRTFMASLLGNYTYEFPEGFPLEIRLKDVLEDEVDEKYYLSSHAGYFKMGGRDQQYIKEEPCVKQIANLMPSKTRDNPNQGRLYDKEGLSPTLGAMQGGNRQPFITVREATKKGYAEAVEGDSINLEQPNSMTRRGRVGHGVAQTLTTSPQQAVVTNEGLPCSTRGKQIASAIRASIHKQGSRNLIQNCENGLGYEGVIEPVAYDEQNGYIRRDGTVGTLTTDGSSPKHNNRIIEVWDGYNQRIRAEKGTVGTLTQNCGADLKRNGQGIIDYEQGLRIRKLTPKECWRLMGFTDADFEKAEKVNSNTQLYKQAGNSIVVDVLMAIFSKLF